MKYLKTFEKLSIYEKESIDNSLIVYHGSNKLFDKFNKENINRSSEGYGIYLTTNKKLAYNYSKGILPKQGSKAMMYLNIVNPLSNKEYIYKVKLTNGMWYNNFEDANTQYQTILNKLKDNNLVDIYEKLSLIDISKYQGYKNSVYSALEKILGSDEEVSNLLERLGYIGIKINLSKYINYIVFSEYDIEIMNTIKV